MHWTVSFLISFLIGILCCRHGEAQFSCRLVSDGGLMSRPVTLNEADSPCVIKNHLTVMPKHTLTLKPGVQLQFFPGKTLIVNGTLIAEGSPEKRIVLTKFGAPSNEPSFPTDIRLVDDFSVDRGRLQVKYKNKWRGICANFVNWTQVDVDVACQQLGFETGNFSFLSFATNDSLFMLYTKPSCVGTEQSILNCPTSNQIRIGSRVCRHQQTVHLRCYGLKAGSQFKDNWSGLELYNASSQIVLDGIKMINESASSLSYVDILYAGVNEQLQPLPALRASPLVPVMNNVTIRFCALDATNFTNVKSSTRVTDSWINSNRGHGLVVETNLGHVEVRRSVMDLNQGNGIKAKFLDGRYILYDELLSFCKMANLDRQTFPQTIIGIPSLSTSCERKFETVYGQRLTLNVLEMDIEPDWSAKLDIYDGRDTYGNTPLLASFNIVNGSLPMGVTSTYHLMFVRFSWTYKKPYTCQTLRDCVKFTIQIDSAFESAAAEFYMNETLVDSNLQHGVYLENARSYIHINASTVTNNGYGAGIRVYGGAGDILVNSSQVNFNQDNGVNITYDGGWKIFNGSSFNNNWGNGINITTNETSVDNKTRYTRHQKTEVSRSFFLGNEGHGVRVGNYCRSGIIAVNDSIFVSNGRDAVTLESCFRIIPDQNVTNFTVAYNRFDSNAQHAVRLSPLLNAVGTVANNTFLNHSRYTLLIDNTDDIVLNEELYTKHLVDYSIISNRFEGNSGQYVMMLRLTEGSQRQRMLVSYNVLVGNTVQGSTVTTLNERVSQYAVIVLSSSNVNVSRNHVENPASQYEISTHLMDMSVTLNAARQWWGTTDYNYIVERLFDQLSRYNLARVSYHPALEHSWLYTPVVTDRSQEIEIPVLRPGNILGGRLATELRLSSGVTYIVDRDINILNYGRLIVPPSTIIEFSNSLGMLVQGYLELSGQSEGSAIRLQLRNESTWYNNTLVRLVPAGGGVYLGEGEELMEGRVEIRPTEEDEWGTVCKEGWTMSDASVICQMMGLVIHPSNWVVVGGSPGPTAQPIYLNQVNCGPLDDDIWSCKAEDRWSHSCNHTQDVYVRCVRPTWAGVRFTASARAGSMSHVSITGAGLMDAGMVLYSPALSIDYSIHKLEYLNVSDNAADGILITHNDIYANSKLANSVVRRNQGNGIVVKYSFFELNNCSVLENGGTGFVYNPALGVREGIQLRSGIRDSIVFDQSKNIRLNDYEVKWVTTPEILVTGSVTYNLEVEVSQRFKIVMDLVDYTPPSADAFESVTVFDTRLSSISDSTTRWQIDRDVLDFPIVSQFSVLTVRWTIRGQTAGRLSFVVRSRPTEWGFPFPVVHILNSTISANSHGIETNHYSQPSDFFLGLFYRFRWETFHLFGTIIHGNAYSAITLQSKTKYDLMYLPTYEELERIREEGEGVRIAEIHIEMESCKIIGNGGGVTSTHNELEYSNNVWIWQLNSNRFEANQAGGLIIGLPRVNLMYTELFNHSVDINDTVFYQNNDFEFRIAGFYCNASIARNRFDSNICKMGCVTIAGTEKDFEFNDNELVENQGQYIMELYMNSHTPYTRWVDARIEYNNFKRNLRPLAVNPNIDDSAPTSRPTTYTLGVRGLQNVTINKNLLSNYLDFELLGGQSSSWLENYLDVTYNWWGTTDQGLIKQRIFDFDDWNNFAIAEYFPFLTADSYSAPAYTGVKHKPILDLQKPLGGRITENVVLTARSTPYIIKSDLTIMPEYSLVIHEGVEIQFYPSVGILVLGSLTVEGSSGKRIKFGPIPRANYQRSYPNTTSTTEAGIRSRQKRQITGSSFQAEVVRSTYLPRLTMHSVLSTQGKTRIIHPDVDPVLGYQIRLTGGGRKSEGFIEIYNRTEMRWSLVCDRGFNEFTAEVACRTMGLEPSNVVIRRNQYYDIFVLGYPKMHEQVIEWFWRESLICEGSEPSLDRCLYRLNYNLYECMENRQYVYVRCGERNLPQEYEYWGNIRYSVKSFENADIVYVLQHIQFADIYGAGYLHDNKVAAVQSAYMMPNSSYVRIHHCASNGYDFVAPVDQFTVLTNNIENNNGYAIGAFILNGESSEKGESQFEPLYENSVPYDMHGLIRMCTAEKLIYVKDRALLYHKYSFETIDCIKIIRSKEPRKQIGIRFLQINLFNDSYYRNAIEMYNGEYFDSRMLIGRISANSSLVERRLLYQTSSISDTMGFRITASPADGSYGFIAEVVTLPLSPVWRADPGHVQKVSLTSMTDNQQGGFVFKNVGENNPRLIFESNYIRRCGVRILNNTEPGVIDIYIQNTRYMTVANNYLADNAAGIFVNTTTKDKDVAIYANITNNVITRCSHGEAMHLEGHPFQRFDLRFNYIANNDVAYRNIFSAFGVKLDFVNNIVYKNRAQCIVNASVPEKISINQRYMHNAIYDNNAFAYNRSTIFLKSAKFEFSNNYLLNPYNVYEMVTFNRTKYPDGMYPSVEARNNWWGRNHSSYVAGRIWERRDDDNLIRVEYEPFLQTNQSVLSGKCYPGWRMYDNKCYWYFGGVVTYSEAESICKATLGRLAWARDPKGRERNFGELVALFQFNYDIQWRVWVYSDFQSGENRCPMLRDYRVQPEQCNALLPFICERDPYIVPHMNWVPIIIILCVVGFILIFILLPLIIFACIKSVHRKEEKMERKEVIQRSLHASRQSLNNTLGGGGMNKSVQSLRSIGTNDDSKRRRPPISHGSFNDLDNVTLNDTTDSLIGLKMPLAADLDYSHHPKSDVSSMGNFFHMPGGGGAGAGSNWGGESASCYADSDYDAPRRRNYDDYYGMPRVENEISQFGHPLLQGTNYDVDDDDDDGDDYKADDASTVHSFTGDLSNQTKPSFQPTLSEITYDSDSLSTHKPTPSSSRPSTSNSGRRSKQKKNPTKSKPSVLPSQRGSYDITHPPVEDVVDRPPRRIKPPRPKPSTDV